MKCTGCGREVSADASFCSHCGAKLSTESGPNDQVFSPGTSDQAEQEEQLWEGGYSPKAMVGSWLSGGLASVVLSVGCFLFPPAIPIFIGMIILLWLALGAVFAYRRLSIYYQVTTQRFIHRAGILSLTSDRIEMIDIDDVTFTQSIIERMFDVGTIKISSSDRTHPVFQMIGVADVKRVADMIDDARRKERRNRSVHIESI